MHSSLLKRAMEAVQGKGKSKAAQQRREAIGTVYNAKPGETFELSNGTVYQVQKNGSFKVIYGYHPGSVKYGKTGPSLMEGAENE